MDPRDEALAQELIRTEPDELFAGAKVPERWNVVVYVRYGRPGPPTRDADSDVVERAQSAMDQLWLLRQYPCADFKRSQFPAVTMRLRQPPGTTHLVFGSANMMVMGMHSLMMAVTSYQNQRFCFVESGDKNFSMFPMQQENSVFAYHAPYRIRIEELHYVDKLNVVFVPNMFPGAIYKLLKPNVVMLIFQTGRVMILGPRDYADLCEAFDHLIPMIEKHSYPLTEERSTPQGSGKKGGAAQQQQQQGQKRGRRNDPNTQHMMAAIRAANRVHVESGYEYKQLVEDNFMALQEEAQRKEAKKRAKAADAEATATEILFDMPLLV
jgi:TATA-box binding protein (TBP) (component of TFIID and TFIIIB)